MKRYLIVLLSVLVVWPLYADSWPGQSNVIASPVDSLKWELDLGVEISPFGGPSIGILAGQERIVLGTNDGIYIIKPDGSIEEILATNFPINTVPALSGDVIYFGCGDSLMAYTFNGSYWWSRYVGDNISHSTIFEDRIYVNAGNCLWVLTLEGDSLWVTDELGGGIYKSAPAVDASGNVYVATLGNALAWYDFRVYAFNPNGTEKWVYEYLGFEPKGIQVTPAIDDSGNIYVATRYSEFCFSGFYSIKDDSQNWRESANVMYSSPAVSNTGKIYYGTLEGLTARLTNGDLFWDFPTASAISYSAPAIGGDGTVYVGTDGGMFLVINEQGNLGWSYDTQEGKLGSPAIDSNGNVYLASESGKLFAFVYSGGVGVEERKDKALIPAIAVHPNPFSQQTVISYQVPISGRVNISIYNASGSLVEELVNQNQGLGRYQIFWNGQDADGGKVANGTYFIRLRIGNTSLTKKLIVVK